MTRAMQGPCEEIEQTCLFRWAALESGAHPELALLHAIPNGGKRSKSEAARMRAATMGEWPLTRYSVCLMASTFSSSAARRTNSTTQSKLS